MIPPTRLRWIEAALAAPVCLWAAWPFYVRAAASIAEGDIAGIHVFQENAVAFEEAENCLHFGPT